MSDFSNQPETRTPARRLIVVSALLILGGGWVVYERLGGPSPASANMPADALDRPTLASPPSELDRRTDLVIDAWPVLLEGQEGPMPLLKPKPINPFEVARTRQLGGTADAPTRSAAGMIRVQSVIAVAKDLRCTIDGKLRRVGDTIAMDGVTFRVDAVSATHVDVSSDTGQFRVPVRP